MTSKPRLVPSESEQPVSGVREHRCGLTGIGFNCPACEAVSARPSVRRYYCEMCDAWTKRGGDCKACGYPLRRAAATTERRR